MPKMSNGLKVGGIVAGTFMFCMQTAFVLLANALGFADSLRFLDPTWYFALPVISVIVGLLLAFGFSFVKELSPDVTQDFAPEKIGVVFGLLVWLIGWVPTTLFMYVLLAGADVVNLLSLQLAVSLAGCALGGVIIACLDSRISPAQMEDESEETELETEAETETPTTEFWNVDETPAGTEETEETPEDETIGDGDEEEGEEKGEKEEEDAPEEGNEGDVEGKDEVAETEKEPEKQKQQD